MHVNLSKQTLRDEPGEPALIQQIMCTADISSAGMTVQFLLRAGRSGAQNQGGKNIKGFVTFRHSSMLLRKKTEGSGSSF